MNATASYDTSTNDLTYDDDDDNDVVEFDGSTVMGDSAAMHRPMSRLLYDVGHDVFQGGEDHVSGVQETDIAGSGTGDVLTNGNDSWNRVAKYVENVEKLQNLKLVREK